MRVCSVCKREGGEIEVLVPIIYELYLYVGFSEAVHAYSTGAGLSQRRLALEVRVPLNPVLVACHRFKRPARDINL